MTSCDPQLDKFRYAKTSAPDKPIGEFPSDGGCYYAMHKRYGKPHYYISANPDHVAAARKQAAVARRRHDRENRKAEVALQKFKGELVDLLERHGATIHAEQLSGDDQGVEVGVYYSIGARCVSAESLP